MTVDIICSVWNGARFLPDFFQSLAAQTHADWRLWVRDDGSVDGSAELVRSAGTVDSRIRLLDFDDAGDAVRLGVARAFGWLLERVPGDANYIMCADQDDVWLPTKIERTLLAMRAAESGPSTERNAPILVHTDLTVVDAELRLVHSSFWEFSRLDPEPSTLRRIAVQNVTTGATVMINRALRDRVGRAPRGVAFHDWWYACVAAAFGRVVALRESTVLYRQHGGNAVGARDRRTGLSDLSRAMTGVLGGTREFRRGLNQSAKQAAAFAERYGAQLDDDDRRFLEAYSRIPTHGFVRRKMEVLRLRTVPRQGVLRALGALLRA